jgi:hypothetical protein
MMEVTVDLLSPNLRDKSMRLVTWDTHSSRIRREVLMIRGRRNGVRSSIVSLCWLDLKPTNLDFHGQNDICQEIDRHFCIDLFKGSWLDLIPPYLGIIKQTRRYVLVHYPTCGYGCVSSIGKVKT